MSESLNGRLRTGNGNAAATEFPHTLPGTRTEIVTFDNSDQMIHSLGSHDEALRYIEDQFPDVNFHVRGNELSMSGPSTVIPRIMRLLEEVRGLVAKGTVVTPDVLQQLVDNGNSIVVIEHNLDIIKVADHIIDLGPEGGDGGGQIIAEGTPEEIAENSVSYTGQYLRHMLEQGEGMLATS